MAECKEFWDDYKAHIDQANEKTDNNEKNDYLIKDGIDESKKGEYFDENNFKILFVLKESNESETTVRRDKSIFDEDGWFGNYAKTRKDKKAITKMTKIYWQITDKLTGQTHKEVKNEDIYKYAFININKHGNGGKTCKTNLQSVMENDGDLLIKQIDYLSPDLIVCGAFGSQALQKCKAYFNDEILNKPKKEIPPVIYTKHFSVVSYNEILEQVTPEMIKEIKQNQKSSPIAR